MKRLLVLLLLLSVPRLIAQSSTAAVSGTITDSSGAAVKGAAITVLNLNTQVEHKAVSGGIGEYAVPLLDPGSYQISVSAPGFKTDLRGPITLQLAQQARVDLALSPGSAGEEVTVTAATPLTDTESAAVGTVVDNTKIVQMPLNGRTYYSLAFIVPGVYMPVSSGTMGKYGGFAVAGSSEASNYYTLDNISDTDNFVAGTIIKPNVDSIQEFKIQVGTYEAEYGHNTGGQVVVSSKTGTNSFHGDVYEFVRNSALDARNYFTAKGASTPFSRNQFGGTVGGPIRKNKTFFFAGYEQLLSNKAVVGLQTVPTASMIAGDFSAYPSISLHAPTGYAAGVVQGNVINTAAMTSSQLASYKVAQALLAYYPAPTNSTVNSSGLPTNNYNFNQSQTINTRYVDVRLDHTISQSDSIYATLHYLRDHEMLPSTTYLPQFGEDWSIYGHLYGVGYTHIFSPNVINQARAGFSRRDAPIVPFSIGIKFDQQYGVPGFTDTSVVSGSIPISTITGYNVLGSATNWPQEQLHNNYFYADTLLWSKGRHNMKFGIDYQRVQINTLLYSSGPGQFVYNSTTRTGNPLADAVLGLPTTATRTPTAPKLYERMSYVGAFVQDEFKVQRNLTINYGLRWETDTPLTDARNNLVTFDFSQAGSAAAAQLVGQGGRSRYPYSIYNGNFGPRIGFSWQPFGSQSTVIRGGYGIGYNAPAIGNTIISAGLSYPVRSTNTYKSTTDNQLMLPDPFTGNDTGTLSATAIQKNWRIGTVQTMSFGVQHQLSNTLVLDVSYLGSLGRHLTNQINSNQATPTANASNIVYPYPFWSSIRIIQAEGNSSYHSLLVKLDKRLNNGFSYLVSYTYGKSLDNTNGLAASSSVSSSYPQNSNNLGAEYGLSDFDVRHRFVVSPVYELPFGRGKRFLTSGVPSKVLGGFQLAGIVSVQAGSPFSPLLGKANSNTNNNLSNGFGYDRPNLVLGQNPNAGPKKPTAWFNTSAFATPAAGQFGSAGRNILIGPRYVNTDLNVSRSFPLPRDMSVQIRAELFNIFNHPNFNPPSATLSSNSYNTISSTNGDARDVQFGVKVLF